MWLRARAGGQLCGQRCGSNPTRLPATSVRATFADTDLIPGKVRRMKPMTAEVTDANEAGNA